MNLTKITAPTEREFVESYVARNLPVVVCGTPFDKAQWVPDAVKSRIGNLITQVYDSLFNLVNVTSLAEYIDEHFGHSGLYRANVPYVRWYNKLKDVEFDWGDEALQRMSPFWDKHACIPDTNLIVPPKITDSAPTPVNDRFPYRALQVAARGARTQLHRDPFCSDAIVSQFYGSKQVALYGPERASELLNAPDGSSFGGFLDVRADNLSHLSHEPDFYGEISEGQMIYIPHGWLHDVIVVEDSISITWNFVHADASSEFFQYLTDGPQDDSEFEVLQYFFALAGHPALSPQQIFELLSLESRC